MFKRLLNLNIVKYFIFSCISSILDFGISYLCYRKLNMNYLLSCNIGIITGLIFHYFASVRYVFKKDSGIKFFFIYMITFFIGLILANGTMWISYDIGKMTFFISKFLSMGIPFFITYFIRKRLLGVQSTKKEENEYENLL